jgi:5-methylcytosine-specific restriction enzyme B
VEVPPDPAKCPSSYGGVNVRALLTRLNDRVEFLRSREHRIGHAELMNHKLEAIRTSHFGGTPRTDPDGETKALAWTIRHKVLPLLLEYFPEQWRRAHAVLGGNKLLDQVGPPQDLLSLLDEGEIANVEGALSFRLPDFWNPEGDDWSTADFLEALGSGNEGVVLPEESEDAS